ncbi:MAG: 16S rRNA (cytosine(1402)-N(4))-methyltransferase RsmH, partial [Gammaproteobacteria bacterium]|nr:16S rRNA (cytosine(1402)-N(4))-methyltransferase RsmH [Gammaproteobacteria bacterium]
GESAAQWLARAEADEIADVLWQYGEERLSRRIAKAIVMDRQKQPFTTTAQLATLLTKILPRDKHKHPATRTFQAIRIHINRELASLSEALEQVPTLLKPQGRLAVISFHSLEDRIVKRFIRSCVRPPTASPLHRRLPRGLPMAEVEFQATLKNRGKAIFASEAEKSANVRSRSAVLRIAERI